MTVSSGPIGRRELNKARTRQALIDAAHDLARQHGLENVTVEDIADHAGVSRRTFFNYFANIEGVVAAGLAEPLQRLADALHRRPVAEDPLTAIAAALRDQPISPEILLGWGQLDAPSSTQREVLDLRIWQHHEEWLVEVLRRRLGDQEGCRLGDEDDLRVRTLAAAVIAMFEVVQHQLTLTAEHLSPEEAASTFNSGLLRALDHARTGWRTG